jgi:hypothetical protein
LFLHDHRPRSATELVDVAVRLFAAHYLTFLALTFVIFAPLVGAVLLAATVAATQGSAALFVIVPAALALVVWFVVADMAILVAASDAYMGREIVLGRALREATSRGGSIVAATLVKTLLMVVGMIPIGIGVAILRPLGGLGVFLAVVVGIVWIIGVAVRFFAAPGTVVFEGVDFSRALERSRELSKGSVGHIIRALLLLWVIIFGIQFAVIAVGSVATSARVAQVISQCAGIFTYPLTGVMTTLLYYDLRIRKEGFDLELAAKVA